MDRILSGSNYTTITTASCFGVHQESIGFLSLFANTMKLLFLETEKTDTFVCDRESELEFYYVEIKCQINATEVFIRVLEE